jgi:hypothetical protein
MRPPMAAMGPLSRCQSSGELLRRDWATSNLAGPLLCDVPPSWTQYPEGRVRSLPPIDSLPLRDELILDGTGLPILFKIIHVALKHV